MPFERAPMKVREVLRLKHALGASERQIADRSEWLLPIGWQLRTDYDDIIAAAPLPERLASLLKQLEEPADYPLQAA